MFIYWRNSYQMLFGFDLPKSAYVTLRVCNILGPQVVTSVDGQKTPGTYSAEFKGGNLSSGVYVYSLEAVSTADPSKSFTQVKKMVLFK